MALLIISVIQSAQVMDNLFSELTTKTCGIDFTPFQNTLTNDGLAADVSGSTDFFSCVDTQNTDVHGHPWGCHVVLSLGFVLTAAMAIPCGMYNLDDNMIVQQVAFWCTI